MIPFRSISCCLLLGLATAAFAAQPLVRGRFVEMNQVPAPPEGRTVAIVGARLIDGRGGPAITDAVVVVRGSSIVAAGPRRSVTPPSGAEIVDAAGLTLVPGLVDAHLHGMHTPRIAALFLGNGVTSARDPGFPIEPYEQTLRSERSPRLFLTGAHLDQEPPAYPKNSIIVRDVAEAKAAVNRFVDQGGTAIKVYFRLPVDLIRATCEAADARGVPVTGHLELVDSREAIKAGLDGLEHVTSVGTAVAEPAMAEAFRRAVDADNAARHAWRLKLWASLDLESARVREMIALLVRHRVVLSPTLTYFYREGPGVKQPIPEATRAFRTMQAFVGKCHAAGVSVVVGSHTMMNVEPGGFAFQREMELLVEAGMTPAQVLVAATMEGAKFLRAEQRFGSIEPGKLADLVLVEGNPLEDVRALRRIKRVMQNGRWVTADR